MKSTKINIVIPVWLKTALHESAAKKGITPSEYVRDLIKAAVSESKK